MQIIDDRRKRVIELYFGQHKTYAEIAEIERIAPRDIHIILEEEEKARQPKIERNKALKHQEISSKAYELFSKGKTPVEAAITLNLRKPEVLKNVCRILETKPHALYKI